MPELLSIHGRCPRCGQVLTLPAGQLHSVFRCARCQYRTPGSTLVERARAAPPKYATSVLGPFVEDSNDQETRVFVPGQDDDAEIALAAVPADVSSAPPPAAALQRFGAPAADDDQHT